jgi:hypothetical protein
VLVVGVNLTPQEIGRFLELHTYKLLAYKLTLVRLRKCEKSRI